MLLDPASFVHYWRNVRARTMPVLDVRPADEVLELSDRLPGPF